MSVKAKYQPVLDLGEKHRVENGYVEVIDNKLRIGGTVENQYIKDKMWDTIKQNGGENPQDIEADIKVANTQYYAKHTVEKGESLSKIAKHYYGDPMAYKHIHKANSEEIKDVNVIHPGQEFIIPFVDGLTGNPNKDHSSFS